MKKRTLLTILWCCLSIEILGLVAEVVGFVFFELSVVAFAVLVSTCGCCLLFTAALLLIQLLKKQPEPEPKPKVEEKSYEQQLIDFYGRLGIPVQYNKDGSIQNPYTLLGLEPEFDENGNLLPTIYEKIGMMPRFTKDGKEIPTVFAIKNRAKRIAKVDLNNRVLTRKLTDKEKEDLLIKDLLKKKLEEAEKNGDVDKQDAIKKIVASKQVKREPEISVKPVKYGRPAAGKAVGQGKISVSSQTSDAIKAFTDLLKLSAAQKAEKPKPEPPKTITPPAANPQVTNQPAAYQPAAPQPIPTNLMVQKGGGLGLTEVEKGRGITLNSLNPSEEPINGKGITLEQQPEEPTMTNY